MITEAGQFVFQNVFALRYRIGALRLQFSCNIERQYALPVALQYKQLHATCYSG